MKFVDPVLRVVASIRILVYVAAIALALLGLWMAGLGANDPELPGELLPLGLGLFATAFALYLLTREAGRRADARPGRGRADD